MNGSICATVYGGCQRARCYVPAAASGLVLDEYYGNSERGQVVVVLSQSKNVNAWTKKPYVVTYVLAADGTGWFFRSEIEAL